MKKQLEAKGNAFVGMYASPRTCRDLETLYRTAHLFGVDADLPFVYEVCLFTEENGRESMSSTMVIAYTSSDAVDFVLSAPRFAGASFSRIKAVIDKNYMDYDYFIDVF